ncbi:uncharacterized protein MONBRDRAFT_12008 [Monosiga brevicollis MX1]|uniref:Uncharacterized protein n=1 Tax=Monosiga brevicollis TaxID=81824 RepID=A9VAY3_MONBE|nr:uncharacterized protein MONBRDRAFT_12008 [Monosiga brevicollis MX1]EDQ85297.1 predicted protein [Monosiga brevicollis MX1]|eukprot:XP_001749918.1 hypothetical protein [Monosiga brevicollis MX1]
MAESKNWRARDGDAAQAGATGAAASQRGTRGPQKAAASQRGAKGPQKAAASQRGAKGPQKAAASQRGTRGPQKAAASQRGAKGPQKAAASQRGAKGPQKAAASTHGAKGLKIPSDLPRAALLMLLDVKAAKAATELFKENDLKHYEARALVHLPLPLPTEREALLKQCCDLIPDDVFAQCKTEVPDAGKGTNPIMMQVLLDKADALNEAHQKFSDEFGLGLALLSTVEGPDPKNGYPNCDVVGSVGFGKINEGELAPKAAQREACEEGCLFLKDRDELFDVCFEAAPSKTVQVYAWTPKAPLQVSCIDKKLELSSVPLAAASPHTHKTSSAHDSEDKDAPSAAKDVSEITERLQKML